MFFYLSKFYWTYFNPFNLILLFFFLTICFFYFKRKFYKTMLIITILLFTIVVIFPTGQILLFQLEKNYYLKKDLPSKIHGILILGGATEPHVTKKHDQVSFNSSVERLTESIKLIKKYPNAKIIFSGGSGNVKNEIDFIHADVAKIFFKEMGLNTNKIIFERNSRNTYENILNSKKIASPKKNETWILITSAFHMNRSLYVAEKINWEFFPYAVDYLTVHPTYSFTTNFFGNTSNFQIASKEWLGILSYYLIGKSSKVF